MANSTFPPNMWNVGANFGPVQWSDIASSIDPYAWAATGIGLSIGLSVIGAAWLVHHFLDNVFLFTHEQF